MQVLSVFDRTQIQSWDIIEAIARRLPALAVLGLGLILLYGVGFASIPAVHNSTHDTRHATGFPCH
jgi:cobalt transporter subunit CbtB